MDYTSIYCDQSLSLSRRAITPEHSLSFARHVVYWPLLGILTSLQWRHNGRDGVSNHQPHDCLLNRSDQRRHQAPRHWPLCGNSPMTDEFPAQMASNTEKMFPFNDVIRWCLFGLVQQSLQLARKAAIWNLRISAICNTFKRKGCPFNCVDYGNYALKIGPLLTPFEQNFN